MGRCQDKIYNAFSTYEHNYSWIAKEACLQHWHNDKNAHSAGMMLGHSMTHLFVFKGQQCFANVESN